MCGITSYRIKVSVSFFCCTNLIYLVKTKVIGDFVLYSTPDGVGHAGESDIPVICTSRNLRLSHQDVRLGPLYIPNTHKAYFH